MNSTVETRELSDNLESLLKKHEAIVLWYDPDEGCYYLARCNKFPGWGGDKKPVCIGGELFELKVV